MLKTSRKYQKSIYWCLRGLTLISAAILLLVILSGFVALPFYASEGNTPSFQDRVLSWVGAIILFVTIVIPHTWTIKSPYYESRIALIILAALWDIGRGIFAYTYELTKGINVPGTYLGLGIGTMLFITLLMKRKEYQEQLDIAQVT